MRLQHGPHTNPSLVRNYERALGVIEAHEFGGGTRWEGTGPCYSSKVWGNVSRFRILGNMESLGFGEYAGFRA